MQRLFLVPLLLAVLPGVSAAAQEATPPLPAAAGTPAPIIRRPPSPAWDNFAANSAPFLGTGITVDADHRATRCILDAVTSDGLFCHLDLGILRFVPFPLPDPDYQFPRPSVVVVRRPDRTASTAIAAGIGFGIAAGFAASRSSTEQAQNALIAGGALGLFAGYLGHALPFIHRTLYRAPHPQR